MPLDEILEDYSLHGMTVLITFTDPEISISDEIEGLYECYQKISTLYDMKHIQFEVIHYSKSVPELQDSMDNIRIYYENNWKNYSTIDQYLSVLDFDLSFEEFSQRVVEK